eukprot:2250688-Amphidinium_carterae.1
MAAKTMNGHELSVRPIVFFNSLENTTGRGWYPHVFVLKGSRVAVDCDELVTTGVYHDCPVHKRVAVTVP